MRIYNSFFKNTLFFTLSIINCNKENFTQFQNNKIAHIGELAADINENNISTYINILENKRVTYEEALKNYNNVTASILLEEVINWKINLTKLENIYSDYLNKKIGEKTSFNEAYKIIMKSLENIKNLLEKNNVNDEYYILINKLIVAINIIKKDENLSIKNLINIINRCGILLIKISYMVNNNSKNNNTIVEIIKIFNKYVDMEHISLEKIHNILTLLEVILNRIEDTLIITLGPINYLINGLNSGKLQ